MKDNNTPTGMDEQLAANNGKQADSKVNAEKQKKGNYSEENDSLDHVSQSIGKVEVKKVSAKSLEKGADLETQVEGVSKFSFGQPANQDSEDVEFMSPVTGAYKL